MLNYVPSLQGHALAIAPEQTMNFSHKTVVLQSKHSYITAPIDLPM
jgi:hypothetical protein